MVLASTKLSVNISFWLYFLFTVTLLFLVVFLLDISLIWIIRPTTTELHQRVSDKFALVWSVESIKLLRKEKENSADTRRLNWRVMKVGKRKIFVFLNFRIVISELSLSCWFNSVIASSLKRGINAGSRLTQGLTKC